MLKAAYYVLFGARSIFLDTETPCAGAMRLDVAGFDGVSSDWVLRQA